MSGRLLAAARAEIEARPEYRKALAQIVDDTGRDPDEVMEEAGRDLDQMASTHVPAFEAALTRVYRAVLQGYSDIRCDPDRVDRVKELASNQTVVFLPSHRSNLDGPALWVTRKDHELPPVLLFGGINMAFWPVGDIMRRLGTR